MRLKCLLGRHESGVPRTETDGFLVAECLSCLRVGRTGAMLTPEEEVTVGLETRRQAAVSELVNAGIWVGTPANTVERLNEMAQRRSWVTARLRPRRAA